MYFSVKDDGKVYWTHSSLIDEANYEKIKDVQAKVPKWQNGFTFFALYGMVEAVNRITPLKQTNLYTRIALVLAPALVARMVAPYVYWAQNKHQVLKQLNGAPLWQKKFNVPELDKMYFFLDDDKNYEPSLWHHGLNATKKFDKLYNYKE